MIYTVFIILQLTFLFLAYKNRGELYWYVIIIFIPILGGIVYSCYLIQCSFAVKKLQREFLDALFYRKRIKVLTEKLKKEDTFINKISLAEAYLKKRNYSDATTFFESAYASRSNNDPYTLKKLIECYFYLNDYDQVIYHCKNNYISRSNSESLFFYGMALEKKGEFEQAEFELRKNNVKYTNYFQRLELSKFLVRIQNYQDAKKLLNEMIEEMENMMQSNLKKYQDVYLEAKALSLEMV